MPRFSRTRIHIRYFQPAYHIFIRHFMASRSFSRSVCCQGKYIETAEKEAQSSYIYAKHVFTQKMRAYKRYRWLTFQRIHKFQTMIQKSIYYCIITRFDFMRIFLNAFEYLYYTYSQLLAFPYYDTHAMRTASLLGLSHLRTNLIITTRGNIF